MPIVLSRRRDVKICIGKRCVYKGSVGYLLSSCNKSWELGTLKRRDMNGLVKVKVSRSTS